MLMSDSIPKIWERTSFVLLKKRLPKWLTVAELTKLSREDSWSKIQDERKVYFKNKEKMDSNIYGKTEYIRRLLYKWMRKGIVKRRKRESNGKPGENPYEHTLTDYGRKHMTRYVRRKYNDPITRDMLLT